MQSTVRVVRAIATLFARRIYLPVAIFVGVASVVLVGLMVWLIILDPLWWILAVPVFLLVIVCMVVTALVGVILQLLAPTQTKTQKVQVAAFVDKIQRLSEVTVTPKFVLLFRTVRDVVAPSKDGFVQSVVHDTSSLNRDFQDLRKSFEV